MQIGAIKIMPGGERIEKNYLINPGIPIPPAATAVHGISDEDVKDAPWFRQISKAFAAWLSGCDLAGYNSDNFDVPVLVEEFARCGIAFPEEGTRFIDVSIRQTPPPEQPQSSIPLAGTQLGGSSSSRWLRG